VAMNWCYATACTSRSVGGGELQIEGLLREPANGARDSLLLEM